MPSWSETPATKTWHRRSIPQNDATLIAETLRNTGFALIGNRVQLDLDKAGFDKAIQAFGNALTGADVALFYYAGHGIQIRGTNYLVPISANPVKEADVDFQMVDVALILRQMEGSGTKLNLVILDACRNNPFGGRGLRGGESGLAQIRAPQGRCFHLRHSPATSPSTAPAATARSAPRWLRPFRNPASTFSRPSIRSVSSSNARRAARSSPDSAKLDAEKGNILKKN